jgi:translation initiation factor eIF-2B subunit delta
MIDDTVEEIREMRTHSSSVVAVKAARALSALLDREFASVDAYEEALERNAGALRRANPSHASLHNAVNDVVAGVVGEADSVEAAKRRTAEVIEAVVDAVESGKRRAAARAADGFADGETILTHDYSSTVLEAVESAAADGVRLSAYVTEARPRYLGRKTARALAGIDRVDATLVVDSAAGHFLRTADVDRVVVGMACIVEETLYNRIGTFGICAAADRLDVPVSVVGSSAKIVGEEGGFAFENEERSPVEVMLEPAEGFAVENPAYDATPTDLVTEVVTDEGVSEL